MRRAAPVIPVSSRLFRHFAVVTVVITAGLAMFANGENREAVAETIAKREAKNVARQAEYDKRGNDRRLVSSRPAQAGGDASVDFGGPSEVVGSWEGGGGSDGSGYDPSGASESDTSSRDFAWADSGGDGPPSFERPPMLGEAGGPAGPGGPGGPRSDQAKGPSGKSPAAARKPARPTRQQLEAMLAASRARSTWQGLPAAEEE
jgi:hypothetical protein